MVRVGLGWLAGNQSTRHFVSVAKVAIAQTPATYVYVREVGPLMRPAAVRVAVAKQSEILAKDTKRRRGW